MEQAVNSTLRTASGTIPARNGIENTPWKENVFARVKHKKRTASVNKPVSNTPFFRLFITYTESPSKIPAPIPATTPKITNISQTSEIATATPKEIHAQSFAFLLDARAPS